MYLEATFLTRGVIKVREQEIQVTITVDRRGRIQLFRSLRAITMPEYPAVMASISISANNDNDDFT